jgi:hypothetical protein
MSRKSASMARRLFAAQPGHPLPHKEKEKSPHTPLKEKEISPAPAPAPAPVPDPDHHACARACEDSQPLGTGAGSVDFFESGFRSEARSGTAKRVKIDRDFILFAEYDPVSIALKTLGIPKISTDETGRQYNNARLMRWAIRIIGEDWFRELVYRQWCENRCDGKPNNIAAAFQAKLYAAKNEAQSAANPGGAASSLPESTKGGAR